MKKRVSLALLVLLFALFFIILPAHAAIETLTYGWTLGKYNATTKTFSPSNISELYWNNMTVRTIGPWSINVEGSRQGSVIAFVDKNSTVDNGYPMVGKDQWDSWITFFKGNAAYVKSALDTWNIVTKTAGTKTFANFAQLAELCGGKGGAYDVANASSIFYRSDPPYSTLTADKTSIVAGENVTFTIKGQTNTYWNQYMQISFAGAGQGLINDRRFTGPHTTTTHKVTLPTPGTYTFKLVLHDSVWRYATEKTITIAVGDNTPPPPPPQDPPPEEPPPDNPPSEPVNQPPTARFSWPARVYEGDTVTVTENSTDPDGRVVDWKWRFDNSAGVASSLGQGGGTTAFANSGTYNLKLTVTDDQGLTDSVTHSITVTKPVPVAVIDYGGSLKENRKVTLNSSSSTSPMLFPIDSSLDEWTITPVSGGAAADIKLGTKSGPKQDILFKKAGIYKVGLRVHNSKYSSEWAYRDIVIVPDDPPIANFTVTAVIFRNPADQSYASIKPVDKSLSLDGDLISQRIWKYKYDSNNDGSFLDEAWTVLDSGNNPAPTLRTNKVGKYLFSLDVKEEFGQETIPEFITDADYRRGDTTTKPESDKITDVKNIPPVTSFTARTQPKADVVFVLGNSAKTAGISNKINGIVLPKFLSNDIDLKITTIENLKPLDQVINNIAWRDNSKRFLVSLSDTSILATLPENFSNQGTLSDSAGNYGVSGGNKTTDGSGRNTVYYANNRYVDVGQSVPKENISNITFTGNTGGGPGPGNTYRTLSFYVSNNGSNWYYVGNTTANQYNPGSFSINGASLPVSSVRFFKANQDFCIDNFFLNIKLNSNNSGAVSSYLQNNNVTFGMLGTDTNKAEADSIISSNLNNGVFCYNSNVDTALDNLGNYFVSKIPANTGQTVNYILLGEGIQCTPTYSDYEKDPKFVDNWYYVHDPNFLDNNSGISFYNNKILTSPVAVFDKVGKYDVTYKAMDDPTQGNVLFLNYRLWSNPSPTSIIVHRKPIASFSVEPGTLNITDISYDPDFQYKRPDKGITEWYWKWKRTTDSTWTVGTPSGIAATGSYDIYLMVKDVYNVWSEPFQKTINVVDPNRPPVAGFTWTPTIIFEGDTVNLINQSFDPDSDPITYQWSVFNPAGSTTGYTTKNISLNNVMPGTYWITLRVWDNHNSSGVATKSFAVNVLNITGYVKHTPEWNTNRINYNRSSTGLDDSPRGYSVFWAGESFVLEAATTDTGSSATKAQHVTVEMLGSGYSASLSGNAGKNYWTGSLWQDSFENISDGTYTFRFKVTYSNGIVKTDDVSIVISGSWQDYFKFHRSW